MIPIGETDEATARKYFENGGCPQERCRGHAFALMQRIDFLVAELAKAHRGEKPSRYGEIASSIQKKSENRLMPYAPISDTRSETTLPNWFDVNRKKDDGVPLNPIEQFVFDNEPAGVEDESEFRKKLMAAFSYAIDTETQNGR